MLAALFGQVTFRAEGGQYEHFINDCTARGIPLQQIAPNPAGITARVPVRYYKRLRIPARKNRVRLRVLHRQGLCFAGRHWRGRWGMVTGAALFLAALIFLQQMVWSVQYVQLPKEQQKQAAAILHRLDLSEGSLVTGPKLLSARQQLEAELPGLGWLSLNFIRGRLVVESAPAAPAPAVQEGTPSDLVAAADGTILELNIRQGHCDRRPGQTVAAGDVLVRAAGQRRNQTTVPGLTRGQVIARVDKIYRCTQPRKIVAPGPTGRLAEQYILCIAGHRLPLNQPVQMKGQSAVRTCPLTFLGFALPARLEIVLHTETAPLQRTLSRQAAEEFAFYACQQELYKEFPDAKILSQSRDGVWSEDDFTLCWRVQFRADIARPAVIKQKDIIL